MNAKRASIGAANTGIVFITHRERVTDTTETITLLAATLPMFCDRVIPGG
jgi:hypothetical protein